MSNRDGFTGGFIAGAAIGGLVGAVLGTVLVRRATENSLAEFSEIKGNKGKKRQLESERIEGARLSLEDKIAQLNQAIDDVRLQLGSVNGNSPAHNGEESLAEDQ
ncbi:MULTISPECIES: hypothetical protein [Kamptonema]|jgi:hypothetical protein|uniref:hypothetical protein n=1 Tax=Kamptonema TaxID=1501433 RepID=UPI0001DAC2BA|nr:MULTISPECIES: hypothetical protein [Kamptonema]CBN56665.1 conserved hypothetical protein [Kamptonema sp. PCC 6506]